jgi:cyclase
VVRKFLLWTSLTIVAVVGGIAIFAYVQVRTLHVVRVTDDLSMIEGLGGNVGVLKTGAGTVIVDTMTFTSQGAHIRQIAEALTGEPVVLVINTHYHIDHTHGNPAFAAGTPVISTGRTLYHLHALDAGYWQDAAAALLPNDTFESQKTLKVGNKTLQLVHPGTGHTDGDLVVLFVEDHALHAGDLFFNRLYPSVDLEAGGSFAQWSDSLDAVLPLPFDQVIPGHGKLGGKADLRLFQLLIREVAAVGREAAARGATLEATLRDAKLTADAGYGAMQIPFVLKLDRDYVVRRSWEEATGHFKRAD